MTKAERIELQTRQLAEMRAREDELRSSGKKFVAGIDEVGRGPLAGPVYAAVVVMPEDWDILGVNDSKKLSAKRREELSQLIRERAVAYGIGIADNHEIDELNILEATKTAMARAIANCNAKLQEQYGSGIDYLLIDAVKLPVDIEQESIIKGDAKCLCIAAASIVAKVARDSYMEEMDEQYPGYDFAGNKGYGTAAHYAGLRDLGYTPIHRRSFLKKFEEEQAGERAAAWGNREKMAKKVYAVRKGRTTGIFTDWDTCKAQVDGFPGAEYKSFANPQDALNYLEGGQTSFAGLGGPTPEGSFAGLGEASSSDFDSRYKDKVRAYVDGSFDAATSRFSCGVVFIDRDAKPIQMNQAFDDEALAEHRNVSGEVMGAMKAIDYAMEHGHTELIVFHDYEGIAKWANDEWKANNTLTKHYKDFVKTARISMKIDFVKVAAHTGNKYNEMADKLAKEALGI